VNLEHAAGAARPLLKSAVSEGVFVLRGVGGAPVLLGLPFSIAEPPRDKRIRHLKSEV
jgi:hypothetical protein